MRYFTILVVLCLDFCFVQAQNTHFWEYPVKTKALEQKVDSLQHIIDSLKSVRIIVKEAEQEQQQEKTVEPVIEKEWTQAQRDSLLHLWYRTVYEKDFEVLSADQILEKRFDSKVSDDVMMQRLKDLNSFITIPFNETVKKYMIYYSEQIPEAMSRILGLSYYYFPIFEEAFNRYGLPQELKYMAVVESFLKPTATSRVGAKGMWQFMYKTAGVYGLEINSFVDERLDVSKAADAAARYLRDLYRIFHDWGLAISSYNCGPGNIQKAIRYADGKTDFWSVYDWMPRETRNYVPQMIGVMYAMEYCREFGLRAADVGMPAQVDTFHINRRLHFKQISEVVGVSMDELSNLNPQYYQQIIPGTIDKPCILNLPYNWSAPFIESNTDSLYSYKFKELLSDDVLKAAAAQSTVRTIYYRVKSGDNLSKIAKKYGVTVSQIKKWNNLRSDKLRIGQKLLIKRR